MAIKIEYDRICIGNFVLCEDANGVAFDGKACANEFKNNNPFTLGTNHAYMAGGIGGAGIIYSFPFSNDGSFCTTAGTLTPTIGNYATSQSGDTAGYVGGGFPPFQNTVYKYNFNSGNAGAASPALTLTQGRYGSSGHQSPVSGYTSGGNAPPLTNTIDKFPFATDSNATDVGDLTRITRQLGNGFSSLTDGFAAGGDPMVDTIDKFPFAVDTNATDAGELAEKKEFGADVSSLTDGYNTGGAASPVDPQIQFVTKFPFASGGPSTYIGGDLGFLASRGGVSSKNDGYFTSIAPPPNSTVIYRFPFANDTSVVSVVPSFAPSKYRSGTAAD